MKNILLRILTVILAVVLVGSLFACESTGDRDDADGPTKKHSSSKTPVQTTDEYSNTGDDIIVTDDEIVVTDDDYPWSDEDPDAPYKDPFDSKTAKPLDSAGTLNPLDLVTFGSYKQNSSGSDKKPIEWIVLKVEGNKALLLSRYVLDAVKYDEMYNSISWENCSLRRWLTEEFAPEAFGGDVSRLIGVATPADKNPNADTNQGGNTQDNIFIMSISEVSDPAYGFSAYNITEDPIRLARATDYAEAKGCFVAKGGVFNGYANWWLRTLGSNDKQASYVYSDGSVCTVGQYIIHKDVGIRPAIWVSIGK